MTVEKIRLTEWELIDSLEGFRADQTDEEYSRRAKELIYLIDNQCYFMDRFGDICSELDILFPLSSYDNRHLQRIVELRAEREHVAYCITKLADFTELLSYPDQEILTREEHDKVMSLYDQFTKNVNKMRGVVCDTTPEEAEAIIIKVLKYWDTHYKPYKKTKPKKYKKKRGD